MRQIQELKLVFSAASAWLTGHGTTSVQLPPVARWTAMLGDEGAVDSGRITQVTSKQRTWENIFCCLPVQM